MSDTTTTRFRIKKTVGSPSVDGASGIETLASHTNNPSAHPDYMKKGALPMYFSASAHISDKLAHCAYYARRSEIMTSKLDYEQTKTMSLANDVSNYGASSGVKRYLVTSYVLNLILAAYGFDGTKTYIETNKIVTSMGTVPTGYESNYVISYSLFRVFSNTVEEIAANYLSTAVAAATYVNKTDFAAHTHEVNVIYGAMNVLGYSYTEDTTFQSGKTYYKYNSTSHAMVADGTVAEGEEVPANTYFEKDTDKYSSGTHEHTILDIKGGTKVLGYVKTADTVPVTGKSYYRYNATSDQMELWTDTGSSFPSGYTFFEKPSYAKTDDVNALEFTVSVATSYAGTVRSVGTIDADVDITKLGFEVMLIGSSNGTNKYTWVNPTAEVANPASTNYLPIYVNAASLVSCAKTSSSSDAYVRFFFPYSWLDLFSGSSTPGIQNMTSLTLKIRAIKRIIAS